MHLQNVDCHLAVTLLLFIGSFPLVNKNADISPILEKCLLLTPLSLTAISPFLCIATPPKGCLSLLMPAFPSTLNLLQSDFCLYHSIKIAHQSTTGPHAIKLNSQLLVLIHLTSRRSNGSGHRSFLFGFLSSLGLYTVLSWFSSNPLAAPPSPFLFSPLPPNPVIVIQAWRFSPHSPLFSFYILSLLSLEALNTPCFCLICALQSPSLLLRHKDILHFLLLAYKSFICKT